VYEYTYDNEGNRTKRVALVAGSPTGATTEYDWDYRNRLVEVRERPSPSGTVSKRVKLQYDALNRWTRTEIDSDGDTGLNPVVVEELLWDGTQLLMQTSGSTTTTFAHGPAVDMVLFEDVDGGAIHTLLGDHLNTVRDVVATNGTVENHLAYSSFGELLSETSSPTHSPLHRYTGRPFETSIGVQYNHNRWYDANVGRWISEDPIGFAGGDANLMRYVANQPIARIDPHGLAPLPPTASNSPSSSLPPEIINPILNPPIFPIPPAPPRQDNPLPVFDPSPIPPNITTPTSTIPNINDGPSYPYIAGFKPKYHATDSVGSIPFGFRVHYGKGFFYPPWPFEPDYGDNDFSDYGESNYDPRSRTFTSFLQITHRGIRHLQPGGACNSNDFFGSFEPGHTETGAVKLDLINPIPGAYRVDLEIIVKLSRTGPRPGTGVMPVYFGPSELVKLGVYPTRNQDRFSQRVQKTFVVSGSKDYQTVFFTRPSLIINFKGEGVMHAYTEVVVKDISYLPRK
jgi:RHS repeat-associated protein